MSEFLTTRQAAERISESALVTGTVEEWQVRRVFETGTLPEPQKFGNKRVIFADQMQTIVTALRTLGYLPEPELVNA